MINSQRSIPAKRISISEKMRVPLHKPKACIGSRHFQILLITGGFFCCYVVRVIMSVVIVAMTDLESPNLNYQVFNWNEATKDLVLSSFFWGYILTQLPAGMIAQRWGAQKIYAYAIGLCGAVTLMIPIASAYGSWQGVCICRIISGLSQGVAPPAIHTLLAKWVPFQERGMLSTFVFAGGWIGNVIALQSSGVLAASSAGWPSVFYTWGSVTLLWSIVWYFRGRESPSEDENIPLDEKEYIEVSLGVTETTEPLTTPWKKIALSGPVWALLIAQSAQTWGFWMLLTKIPNYMNSVLKFKIQDNGLISSIPYLSAWLLSFPVSYVSDLVIRKNVVKMRTSRLICNSIGQFIPAIALIVLGYVQSDDPVLTVGILVIAVTANMTVYCGHHVNHMDLSPNFAGPLMGCLNAIANICSIIAPLMAGTIVKKTDDVIQWRSVFFLTAGIYILGALAFLFFSSTKVQEWNDPCSNRKNSMIYEISAAPPSRPDSTEKIERNKSEKSVIR